MSDSDYIFPDELAADEGVNEVFEEEAIYIFAEPHKVNPVDNALKRLETAMSELDGVINKFPEEEREQVREACEDAVLIYGKSQRDAERLITAVSSTDHLTGELLDGVMYIRCRLNGLERALQDNPAVTDACVQQVLADLPPV
jgi:hypothetical protein